MKNKIITFFISLGIPISSLGIPISSLGMANNCTGFCGNCQLNCMPGVIAIIILGSKCILKKIKEKWRNKYEQI